MIDLTAAEYQQQVLDDLGDPDAYLAPRMPRLWRLYADKAGYPRQQYLFVKQAAIGMLIGTLRQQVTMTIQGDATIRLSDQIRFLEDMQKQVAGEIALNQGAQRQPVGGVLTTQTILVSPVGGPDASGTNLVGDPNTWPPQIAGRP